MRGCGMLCDIIFKAGFKTLFLVTPARKSIRFYRGKIRKKTVSRRASLKKIQESRKIGHNSIKGILKKYFPLQSLYLFGYYAVLFMVVSYNNLLLLFDRSSSS